MRAAFFDVDGTLTKSRVWNGLMDYFRVHRIRPMTDIIFGLYHYGLYGLHKLGVISQVAYREPWAEHLSWYFRGYSMEQAKEIWDWVIHERIAELWREDICLLLREHLAAGDKVFLVSGGPEGLLRQIGQEFGVDYVVGTKHEIVDGYYTGRAESVGCQGENKLKLAMKTIDELGLAIDFQNSFAYADSVGDIYLLRAVGNPVAVYPDAELRLEAERNEWKIIDSQY
jgi:HAD superfamily hydrolase (TIGR01490 family)